MLDQQVILRTSTLVNLVRRCGTEPHSTLNKGATWYSAEAQKKLDHQAEQELASLGLAGPRGIHPGLLATVNAIAHPQLEYYGWVGGPHEGETLNLTILAGTGAGGEAFVVVRNIDRGFVVLANVPTHELLDNFLAQLPWYGPARGQQVVVPKSAVTGGKRDTYGDDFQLMRTNTPDAGERAAAEFSRILGLERVGGGSLYVAVRTRGGTRQRIEKPVTYIDTVEGRWLTEEVPGVGETQYVCTPATPRLLGDRLRHAQGRLVTV